MIQSLEDCQLSVLVPFILENFFDSDKFSRFNAKSFNYNSKSAWIDDSLDLERLIMLKKENKRSEFLPLPLSLF